jgi:glycosyltransferase involved in cell wall biosynthesis
LNAERTINRAVESVCAQTFTDWECLVVDDGSTDATCDRMAAIVSSDHRVRLIRQPHAGIVSALQRGCAEAKGEYIARMDADDKCLPARLQLQVSLLDRRPEIGVAGCRVVYGGDSAAQGGYKAYVEWTNQLISPEDHARYRFVESPLAHPSVMFRRELLQRHGGYAVGHFPEDYELWLRWMQGGIRIEKVPDPGLVWYDPPGRLSRSGGRYDQEAFYGLKMKFLAATVPKDRPVWLWGAGRVTRKRFAEFERLHSSFTGFVDVDPEKIGQVLHGRRVVSPEDIPHDAFVLSGVGNRGIRTQIEAFLDEKGYKAEADYWLCA